MRFFLNVRIRQVILCFIDFLTMILSCMVGLVVFMIARLISLDRGLLYEQIFPSMIIYSLVIVASLILFGVYKTIWRYARLRDILGCIVGIIFGTGVYTTVLKIFEVYDVPEIYFVFSGMFGIVIISIVRMVYLSMNSLVSYKVRHEVKNKVMIVGAGMAGKQLCEQMKANKRYNPVVFIDDDSDKIGRIVNGVPVKGNTNEIVKIATKMNISEIVLAIPSISGDDKRRILNICSETLCKVSILPTLDDYIHSDNLKDNIKKVEIEDLLGRETVKFDTKEVSDMIRNKICMVTGGGGSIGSELVRQIAKMSPRKLIVVDIYENNAYDIQQELARTYREKLDLCVQIASVRDAVKMEMLFEQFKPDIVFHAAAHKHVPLMETNPEEAIKNNIFGTLNTAKLARKYEVEKFVLVSTDKAVNPTNIMGATKRCCEMIIECMAESKSSTEFVAVRFGNVLGSNGSVIPLFEKQIATGGPVTVTDPNIIRYFMTIPEASSLILHAATLARGGEIFVLDMGEPVKILSLAENLIKLHGLVPYEEMPIKFTGLRPGEKLYEELLMNEEGLKSTANNKIFIGKQVKVDEDKFFKDLERLKNVADINDKENCEKILREIVPTFVRKKYSSPEIIKSEIKK